MEVSHVSVNSWSTEAILSLAVLALPFLSFIITSLVNNKARKSIGLLSAGLMVTASILAISLSISIWPSGILHSYISWFDLASYHLTAGVLINFESASMLVVVTVISALVHLYSIRYMANDEGYKRYFTFLGLFTFAMIGIVISDNLLCIFMFWELVGLSSYLLIGHWYKKESASMAANKAFIVNRIGDAGFLLGIAILWAHFKTMDIQALAQLMSQSSVSGNVWISADSAIHANWLTAAGICLFLGAIGKSAQFPLQVWLPDAMEGPTPISALIHAATMVAAGVYLMIRVFPLLDINTLTVIAIIGSVTAFMGAIAALTQHDIKKVLAYSTISQLGYMLMGIGVGAYGAAYFHLFTHAFFKAGLFLSAGSVIYALHQFEESSGKHFDAQDMRNMGGLRRYLPVTFIAYLISALALVGIPFFSGFLSKDALLSGAMSWAGIMSGNGFSLFYIVPVLGFITVILTAVYMTRQILLVFFGDFRLAENRELPQPVIESPLIIRVCLIILSVLSVGLVWSLNPFDFNTSWFLAAIQTPIIMTPGFSPVWQADILRLMAENHLLASGISVAFVAIGLLVGFIFFKPSGRYAQNYFSSTVALGFFRKFSYYNWYLDPLYFAAIQQPVLWLARRTVWFESKVINKTIDIFGIFNVILAHTVAWFDKNIVDGVVRLAVFIAGTIGRITKSLQGGKVQNYIVIAILGLLLIIYWII